MNWLEILLTSGITSIGIAAIVFIAREWLAVRLKESVAVEYKRSLEEYKQQLEWQEQRKMQAVELAEFFSVWMKHHYYPDEDVNHIRYELQKMYWKLALWLDAPVLKAVHEALKSSSNPGLTHKKALIAVRKLYVDAKDDIAPEELFHFDAIQD